MTYLHKKSDKASGGNIWLPHEAQNPNYVTYKIKIDHHTKLKSFFQKVSITISFSIPILWVAFLLYINSSNMIKVESNTLIYYTITKTFSSLFIASLPFAGLALTATIFNRLANIHKIKANPSTSHLTYFEIFLSSLLICIVNFFTASIIIVALLTISSLGLTSDPLNKNNEEPDYKISVLHPDNPETVITKTGPHLDVQELTHETITKKEINPAITETRVKLTSLNDIQE